MAEVRLERWEESDGPPTEKRMIGVLESEGWVGSALGGGLFVLKGDAYSRLSVGGPESQAVKIEKLKKLARIALRRLP